MAEPVNAAIEKALLDKAIAFATAQSLTISLPNGIGADGRHFTKPPPSKNAQWLRATVLHAPALSTGISFTSSIQHYGFLQIDVITGIGGGTMDIQRTVSAIRAFFPLGLELAQDDFKVQVSQFVMRRGVSEGPLMNDADGWVKVPVSIPWVCFEQPA